MAKPNAHAQRDEELTAAIQKFFTSGQGDMHEFKHVVENAIDNLPVTVLELTPRVHNVLAENGIHRICTLKRVKDTDLISMPGIGMVAVRQIQNAYTQFNTVYLFVEERRGVRSA